MTISLDLPSELENELSEEASRLKLPLAEYILRVLAFRPFTQNLPKTGAELVAYWEKTGVIDLRSDITIEGTFNPIEATFYSSGGVASDLNHTNLPSE